MEFKRLEYELHSKNLKLTPQRREILKVLTRAKRHLSAREIFERIQKKKPNISFDTVYRNLAVLKRLHLVNQLDFQDGRGYYELNRVTDHHHHIVCLKCGESQKIGDCPFNHISASMPDGFKAVSHRFEIYGYCRHCQE